MTKEEKLTKWGPGPWVDEPDRVEFKASGFPALLKRNDSGAWCGYVAVPPGHPLHGASMEQLYFADTLRVHGDVTYASVCAGEICHVPAPGEPDDVFWIGFDCAHAGDFVPGLRFLEMPIDPTDVYRTQGYAVAQVRELARQLAEVK